MTTDAVRASLTEHLFALYRRTIANRPRVAYDCGLLREIVQRLEELAPGEPDARLATVRADLASSEAVLAMSLPPAELIGVLAARANQQFAAYSRHFAGRSRVTRRPALVARLEANLSAVLADMRTLAQTHQDPNLTANIALVEARLAQTTGERQAIAAERAAGSRDDLIRLLGADLNTELVTYRKQRAQLGTDGLAAVCDRLGELATQMYEIARETDDTIILATLRLATRELGALEAEYAAASAPTRHLSVADLATHGPAWRAQLACAVASDERRREAIARLDAVLEDPLVRQLVVDARSSRT